MNRKLPKPVLGYLVKAFRYGAPPHGGIALGMDRMIALLTGSDSIRDVMAFPNNNKGVDLMSQAPSPVDEKQLRECYVQVKK
jgi:Aspartyl-tRNA synthetase